MKGTGGEPGPKGEQGKRGEPVCRASIYITDLRKLKRFFLCEHFDDKVLQKVTNCVLTLPFPTSSSLKGKTGVSGSLRQTRQHTPPVTYKKGSQKLSGGNLVCLLFMFAEKNWKGQGLLNDFILSYLFSSLESQVKVFESFEISTFC